MTSTSKSSADDLADTYGGDIIDDSDYGEPESEQAYEDVVGIADEEAS